MEIADPHYQGTDIVPEDSFLRTLPMALNAEQRLRADALVFSADTLTNSWLTLRQVAIDVGSDISKMTRRHRAILFAAAWAIVDHLNVSRQIIRSMTPDEGEVGPLTGRFMALTEPARSLRNKMDHLNANIRNLAFAKGQTASIFGTLSYFVVGPPPYSSGHAIVVQTGLVHGKEAWHVVNPAGRTFVPPVDLFELHAFGHILQFGAPLAILSKWLTSTALDWERQVQSQVLAGAEKLDVPIEELMKHSGAGFTVALEITFNGEMVPASRAE